ncbi:MAG: hypothetical protein MMC33_009912 [Icmadophila ericetorum]|nr:hypothetical protein [Icmadophila ericetorum]
MSPVAKEEQSKPGQCPFPTAQFQRITKNHKVLAATGCTKDFCQAGRLIHTDEPRVGENRGIAETTKEAEEFLRELHREGFYGSEAAFQDRLTDVLDQIKAGAVNGKLRKEQTCGDLGGNWAQTPQELEFGLRRAWRNSRKCIMRSHCEELRLCDLRSITSSADMATELMKGMVEAFNSGTILPTAFIFPPRSPNKRGPVIWNNALLAFAGYENETGTILGDPINVQLTKDIMELGWNPPELKTRWDLLPLVTMAEGDLPVFTEIPREIRELVPIMHPRYDSEFRQLDLKWVAFPALTRLGFDIGGVQYTATPFIGWFMDAEIGIRNLADSFRYNVLPDIIEALGLAKDKLGSGVDSFEDLPEFERLQILSRAQSELNYAVYWSFLQAKVSITDTLTASTKYMRYDDEFLEKKGYRLPADPYWLAPPQGSIVPLWHRGGSPNYQPKPLICRHVQDPIKAWRREGRKRLGGAILSPTTTAMTLTMSRSLSQFDDLSLPKYVGPTDKSLVQIPTKECWELAKVHCTSISVYYCSAGTVAEKIATRLHEKIKSHTKKTKHLHLRHKIRTLNCLDMSKVTKDDVILLVVSTTGQGQVPANGADFMKTCEFLEDTRKHDRNYFRFAVFGNGDSRYSSTYNGAAIKVHQRLLDNGATPLVDTIFPGDTAIEPVPTSAMSRWWEQVRSVVTRPPSDTPQHLDLPPTYSNDLQSRQIEDFAKRARDLQSTFKEAILTSTSLEESEGLQGSVRVTFAIGMETYQDLSCIQVLPINSPPKVASVLRVLRIGSSMEFQTMGIGTNLDPTYREFLTDYADLELPFSELKWLEKLSQPLRDALTPDVFRAMPVRELLTFLETIQDLDIILEPDLRRQICLDMPLLHPRTFSVASSLSYLHNPSSLTTGAHEKFGNTVDLIVKVHPSGRFSSTYLTDSLRLSSTKIRFVDSISSKKLLPSPDDVSNPSVSTKPLIIVATGAGFAPVRSLFQSRVAAALNSDAYYGHRSSRYRTPHISIFLGLRPADFHLVTDVLAEAVALDLVDILSIVPSNPKQLRVYEKLLVNGVRQELKRKLCAQGGRVLVCTMPMTAKETALRFNAVVGGDIKEMLGERYVEEVF